MSPETQEIIDAAAKKAVAEFAKERPCRFDDDTAKTVHEIHDAKIAESADSQTFRIIIQMGKSWQDITKSMRKSGMGLVILLLLLMAGKIGVPALMNWILK